jgi:hypothetical protein
VLGTDAVVAELERQWQWQWQQRRASGHCGRYLLSGSIPELDLAASPR